MKTARDVVRKKEQSKICKYERCQIDTEVKEKFACQLSFSENEVKRQTEKF